jgi:hypothetical protein
MSPIIFPTSSHRATCVVTKLCARADGAVGKVSATSAIVRNLMPPFTLFRTVSLIDVEGLSAAH